MRSSFRPESQAENPSPKGWGPSIRDGVFDDFRRGGAPRVHAVSLMYVVSITYLKIHGYRATSTTDAGKHALQERGAFSGCALDEGVHADDVLGFDVGEDRTAVSRGIEPG